MDSITQAVLGASIQGALLGSWQGRKALLYGAALSTLPDLDVVIDYGDALAEATAAMGDTQLLQQPRRAQVQACCRPGGRPGCPARRRTKACQHRPGRLCC